ncbi:putative MFS-type transporter EfpA [Apilactobacillus kunkeei]|nr:putative MFS-type transporter EfpA [Apilactobacillus kunkeei]CAI2555930.1 putative MFS-type transporter EfpA [Apilactobacillus kunkeei]CAI2801084.1 putative MFS-type transporter EfpA [Apilactobacillus kunkeei]
MKYKFGIILPIILISYFLILLDNSVVFTSTVQIANSLHMTSQSVAWITNIYALVFGSLLLIGGRLGDLYGRKPVFLTGLVIFTLFSLLVGLAPNGLFIIAMRAFQGIGSAILAPTSLALLLDTYEGKKREKAISFYGVTAGLGASVGLIIGGLVTTFYSWRVGFLINVPLGILLILLTILFVPKATTRVHAHLDYIGSILSVLAILSLVNAINGTGHKGLFIGIFIVLLVIFLFREVKIDNPIMPMAIFKDPERVSAYIARFFYIGSMFSFFFLVPQVLQKYYGFTPLLSAFGFMPETIPQFLFGMLQSKLSNKYKNENLLLFGTIVTLIGVLMLFVLDLEYGYTISVAVPMIVIGIGQGFSFGPLTVSGVANTPKELGGATSSAVNVFHQLGSSILLSLVVTLTAGITNVVTAYHYQTLLMTILMLVPLLMAINIKRINRK